MKTQRAPACMPAWVIHVHLPMDDWQSIPGSSLHEFYGLRLFNLRYSCSVSLYIILYSRLHIPILKSIKYSVGITPLKGSHSQPWPCTCKQPLWRYHSLQITYYRSIVYKTGKLSAIELLTTCTCMRHCSYIIILNKAWWRHTGYWNKQSLSPIMQLVALSIPNPSMYRSLGTSLFIYKQEWALISSLC